MGPDFAQPAHARAQDLRDFERTVGALVVLHDRDQRAPDRDTGAVEAVHETGPLALRGPTEIRAHA